MNFGELAMRGTSESVGSLTSRICILRKIKSFALTHSGFRVSTRPRMRDISEELREAVRASGKTVTAIAEEAGVAYHKLSAFLAGRTKKLDANMAQLVFRSLTGKELV